jgi:hypothetical protein
VLKAKVALRAKVVTTKKASKVACTPKKVIMKGVKASSKKIRKKKKFDIKELCDVGTVLPAYLCPQFDENELVPASALNDTMFELTDIMLNATDLSALSADQNLLVNSATSQSRGYVSRKAAIVERFFAVL